MAYGPQTEAAPHPTLNAKSEALTVENASDKLASTIDRLMEAQKCADEMLLRLSGPMPATADLSEKDARGGGSLAHLHDRADAVARGVDLLFNVLARINEAV